MNKVPALVILSPGFPANEADTTCLPAQQDFVRLLKQITPLEVIVVAFQYPFTDAPYEWNGITVVPLNGRNRRKPWRILTWIRAWRTLNRLRARYRITGLLSFWLTECALVGKWFGRRHAIRHHCWMLGQDARAGNGFVKWIRPAAGELIAMSDALADEFCRHYGLRPEHIAPNGVDPSRFGPRQGAKTIDLLSVGSLIPLKRHELFLQLVRTVKQTRPSVVAMICGRGPEEGRLRSLIREYDLEGAVSLAGELPHPEVLQLMQRTRVLVHPSSYEGFSTVCLEALYAGARVVSFCRPMKATIANWYIVATYDEMTDMTLELLGFPDNDVPVMPFAMIDNARAILRLFPYSD